MSDIAALVADNLDIWTGAIERKGGAGRGGGKRISLYGIDRLRALILDLAVRGKLVPQDAGEEPAQKFLERLGVPLGKTPKSSLNQGWAEASLAQLGEFVGGITPSKGVQRYWGEGHPWVSPKDMGEDQLITSEDQVTQAALNETSLKMVPAGSLVMVARSGILRRKFPVAITNMPCTLNQDMKALILRPSVDRCYLQVMLKGFQPRVLSQLVKTGMTVESLIFKEFTKALWPLPPLAEQQRIVAKVDELMALCDALERDSAEAMAAHQALVEILLATLVNSADATDLARDWARLESHFDTLFTTDASIDALKQTILDLAVRGKLVEQDANDGSAAKAISQTKLLKQELIQKKDIRKDKTSLPITEEELPFVAPSSWEWSRIGTVALSTEYGTSRKATSADSGIIVLAMGNIKNGVVDLDAQKSIPQDSEEVPQLILKPGDILYNRTNSYELVGKTGIFRHSNEGYSFASYLIRIRLDERTVEPEFLNMAMNTPYFRQTQVVPKITKQTGQANVSGGAMRNMLIPIPPLAEQNRIVAKVDALMALCDALKARIADAAQTQRHLADAITQRAAA